MPSDKVKADDWLWSGVKAGCAGYFGTLLLLVPMALCIQKEIIPTGRENLLTQGALLVSAVLCQWIFGSKREGAASFLAGTAVLTLLLVVTSAAMKDAAFSTHQIAVAAAVSAAGNALGALIKSVKNDNYKNRRRRNITNRNQNKRFT